MNAKKVLLLVLIIMAIIALAVPTVAQRDPDSDGDGIPDTLDSCPKEPGPRENGGCPLPDESGNTGGDTPDRDGDGVPDYVDSCPDQAGTGYTNGCPDEQSADTSPDTTPTDQPHNPPKVIFTWGSGLQCMVGLFPTAPTTVNIRQNATTGSAIIGQLLPGQQFAPLFVNYDKNGDLWFGRRACW